MTITRLQGGLGNQMFQYALGRCLSLRNNTGLILDANKLDSHNFRTYALHEFTIAAEPAGFLKIFISKIGKKHVKEKASHAFDPEVLEAGANVYLDGHWQNEKYFLEIADTIRKDFKLKDVSDPKLQSFVSQIKETNSVSVHIRRTDYLTPKHQKVYAQLPLSYYEDGLKKIGAEKVFIFSDDIEWVKTNFKPQNIEVVYVSDQGFTDGQELFLMSQCKHNITANSTFSWWGAWLNENPNKIVISPEEWYVDRSQTL